MPSAACGIDSRASCPGREQRRSRCTRRANGYRVQRRSCRRARIQGCHEAFQNTVSRKGDGLAIKSEEEGVELSWNDVDRRVRALAGGLKSLGVERGDRVGMLLGARSDFIPIDLAAVSIGALPSRSTRRSHPTPDRIRGPRTGNQADHHRNSDSCSNPDPEARKNLSGLEKVVVIGGEGGDMTLEEVAELIDPDFDPAPIAAEVGLDDPLTLTTPPAPPGPRRESC